MSTIAFCHTSFTCSRLSNTALSASNWLKKDLRTQAKKWCADRLKQLGAATEKNPLWDFLYHWPAKIDEWIKTFRQGLHCFSPLTEIRYPDAMVQLWSPLDRLVLHWLYRLIKPTFKHVISPSCLHLKGPGNIKTGRRQIEAALKSGRYRYFIQMDIASYYASIRHADLLRLLFLHYADPILRHYFTLIVTVAIDRSGLIRRPTKGIPIPSSLSPFFAALYLSPCDQAFTDRKGVFYVRYVDDLLILVETKSQFIRAKKRLSKICRSLGLKYSPSKTRMGALRHAVHWCGIDFVVASQNAEDQHCKNQLKTPLPAVRLTDVRLHPRSARRALDKVLALKNDAVHPAIIQRYLVHWVRWWLPIVGCRQRTCLENWIQYTALHHPDVGWLGSGLITTGLGKTAHSFLPPQQFLMIRGPCGVKKRSASNEDAKVRGKLGETVLYERP